MGYSFGTRQRSHFFTKNMHLDGLWRNLARASRWV